MCNTVRHCAGWLVCGLFLLSLSSARAAECGLSADPATMSQQMLGTYAAQTRGRNVIAVMPFFDNAGVPDATLPQGIGLFLFERYGDSISGWVHPAVTVAAAQELGLSGAALADIASARQMADKLKVRFVVFGSLQLTTGGEIRLYIDVYDARRKINLSALKEAQALLDDSVFFLLQKTVTEALKEAGLAIKPSPDTVLPTLAAFRARVKGWQYSQNYSQSSLELATAWYEKALKMHLMNSDDDALGLSRVWFMRALMARLSGADETDALSRAGKALERVSLAAMDSRRATETLRLISGRTLFLKASALSKSGKTKEATTIAKAGLLLVPEDGMLQNLKSACMTP